MTSATTVNQKATSSPAQTPKKKRGKLDVGTQIRVLDTVVSPDFPDISCGGWTGKIVQVSGRKAPYKYFVDWHDEIANKMPQSYVERCEAQQIYHRWACLKDTDFASAE